LRFSGHYYPHELAKLIQLTKPKEFMSVHTEDPALMLEVFRRLASLAK